MGCWNATCGLTQLPILHGEKVLLYILKPTDHREQGRCYPDELFKPYFLPIKGQYNDYGGIEKVEKNIVSKLLLAAINMNLNDNDIVTREDKRDYYHQLASEKIKHKGNYLILYTDENGGVDRKYTFKTKIKDIPTLVDHILDSKLKCGFRKYDYDDTFDIKYSVEEYGNKIREKFKDLDFNTYTGMVNFDYMFVREQSYNTAIEAYKSYLRDKSCYYSQDLEEVKKRIETALALSLNTEVLIEDSSLSDLVKYIKSKDKTNTNKEELKIYREIEKLKKSMDENTFKEMCSSRLYISEEAAQVYKTIKKEDKLKYIDELVQKHLEHHIMQGVMMLCRKQWFGQVGGGSQSQEYFLYDRIYSEAVDFCKKKLKEREE